MNRIKTLSLLIAMAGFFRSAMAAVPLHVGDSVPDIVIKNVINSSSDQITLSEHNDKLIVLHFFSIYCGTCVQELTTFDSLQHTMPQIKIIPITNRGSDRVQQLIKEKNWTLPFAISGNEDLYDHFPHRLISHIVWIKDKTVIAITGGKAATAENMRKVLAGNPVDLPLKDDQLNYDRYKPLLVDGNGGSGETLKFQSVITGEIKGISGGFTRPPDGLKLVNASILYLYQQVFTESSPENYTISNRVILELSKEKEDLITNKKGSDVYCYSLFVPEGTSREKKADFARNDLNRYFGTYLDISGRIEKRKVKCLALVTADKKRLVSNGAEPVLQENDQGELILQNQPVERLIHVLTHHTRDQSMPVIDKTGFTGNIDITLSGDLQDLQQLKKSLNKNGLDLEEQVHAVNMLVIQERE